MVDARGFTRLAMLATGLGIAAAMACSPGTASADSSTDWWSSADGLLGGGFPALATTLDYQISIDGVDLLPTDGNTATANSGMGDFAIAIGNGSTANAGAGDAFGQTLAPGQFDSAFAMGTNSFASAGQGDFNSAFADGTGSVAASGGYQGIVSNGDWASATGAHTDAEAGVFDIAGQNDGALVFDPFGTLGSTAEAGDGNVDLASVFGDGSTALAGFPGSYDLGAAFGDGLTSSGAQNGNFLVDIVPSLFGEGAASTAAADSGNILTDFLSLF